MQLWCVRGCLEGVGVVRLRVPRRVGDSRLVVGVGDRQVRPARALHRVPRLDRGAAARRRGVRRQARTLHRLARAGDRRRRRRLQRDHRRTHDRVRQVVGRENLQMCEIVGVQL